MCTNPKFRLVYHDINGNLQSVLGLLDLSELPDEEKYQRVKPYLFAINNLYSSLSREKNYDAKVGLKRYLSKFSETFFFEHIKVDFNLDAITKDVEVKAKTAVYLGMFFYEFCLTLFSNYSEKEGINHLDFNFNQKLNIIFVSINSAKSINHVNEFLQNFTLLNILAQQLKLKSTVKESSFNFQFSL